MRSKKILALISVLALSISLMVGCTNKPVEDNNKPNEVVETQAEDLLLEYNEEGMKLLKANYTTTDEMKVALKNIGQDISNMKFKTYSGSEISLKDYKGKNVILEVSQASCGSCKESAPLVREAIEGTDIDVEVIPLFLNSNKEEIDGFYNELGLEKEETIIIDEEKISVDKFALTKTPTFIFVDTEGKISLIKEVFIDANQFASDMESAFGETKIYELKAE